MRIALQSVSRFGQTKIVGEAPIVLEGHLTAPLRILRAAQRVLRHWSKAEPAVGQRVVRKVLNISSVAGLFGNAGQSNYAIAKADIVGLTQTLAKAWGCLNVTVNGVVGGFSKTRLTVSAADDAPTTSAAASSRWVSTRT